MDDLRTRVITALIVAPFVVLCFVSYKSLVGLVAAIVLIAGFELLSMELKNRDTKYFYLFLVTLYPILAGFFFQEDPSLPLVLLFIVGVGFSLLVDKDPVLTHRSVFVFLLTLFYVSYFLSFFLPIYRVFGMANSLLVLSAVWAYDSFAYFVGMKFGKTRISPHYSPRKSLEGLLGGLCGVLLYSLIYKVIFQYLFRTSVIGYKTILFFSALVAVMDTFGDVFESALKRYYGVKDSGKALPGHGGMLDRIDGLLFVTPTSYILFKFLEGVM